MKTGWGNRVGRIVGGRDEGWDWVVTEEGEVEVKRVGEGGRLVWEIAGKYGRVGTGF